MAKKLEFKRNVNRNPEAIKDLLKHVIQTNDSLQERNLKPVALEIMGHAGLGKTSIVYQVGEELNKPVIKINLAQMDELGDLVGFPLKEYEIRVITGKVNEEGNVHTELQWVNELHAKMLLQSKKGTLTGKTRMGYALPEWLVNNKTNENGCILLLDDFSRAQTRFMQATMEIIDRGEFYSWKLPKNWSVVMTSNPPDGGYLVQATDVAQQTRFMSVNAKFNKDDWAAWAENVGIDTRCINFVLYNDEIVEQGLEHGVNPRALVNFFNAISTIKDFSTAEGLAQIQVLGEACVGNAAASMFVTFVNNKLDRLPTPEFMMHDKDGESVIKVLKQVIGTGDNYRPDIAYVLSTRMTNYSIKYAKDNTLTDEFFDRFQYIIDERIFNVDVCYNIVRSCHAANSQKFKKLANRKSVMKYLTTN